MSDVHRHDLGIETWARLWPLILQAKGKMGRRGEDNLLFFNAVLHFLVEAQDRRAVARPAAVVRKLVHGGRPLLPLAQRRRLAKAAGHRLRRARSGVADDRRQPHQGPSPRRRRKGGNQALARTKGGLNTKLHLAVDALGLPVRMIVTGGTTADCSQAMALLDGFMTDALMADKAYDTNEILEWCDDTGAEPVIPPKANRKDQRNYDEALYKLRHLVEIAFLKLKQWRSVATRYAKTVETYLAECQIAAIMLWIA